MKKSLIKKISILFLLVALVFSSIFLVDLIKKEKIRKEEFFERGSVTGRIMDFMCTLI